jgi:hypothetical protein
VLVLAPAVTQPGPPVLMLAFRVVAAVLAAYLLFLAARMTDPLLEPAPLGGTPEAGFVIAAAILGWLIAPGAPAALAAAAATSVAAATLLAFGRDGLRIGAGGIMALVSAGLWTAVGAGASADSLVELALGISILVAAALTTWLALMSLRARAPIAGAAAPPPPPERS